MDESIVISAIAGIQKIQPVMDSGASLRYGRNDIFHCRGNNNLVGVSILPKTRCNPLDSITQRSDMSKKRLLLSGILYQAVTPHAII